MSKLSNFFDWLFNRKRVVFMGLSGSGKTTFLEVLKTKKDVDPKKIDLHTGGRNSLSTKFNGYRIRSTDIAGSDYIYIGDQYTEDLNKAQYYIYIFDCYRYLEAKLYNKVPDGFEDEIFYKKQTDEELKKYLEQTKKLLQKMSKLADQKEKKMIIIATHADKWLGKYSHKTKQDLNNILENNIFKDFKSISQEIVDITKYKEVIRIIDILFKKQ